ncbi:PQQ-dependent sugar dehydrogenase [Georgenia faecalis]|uniref:PQQ-dependent sugar dehydrogenase n=1 Tax=Georgenia faecalis TaxID=2483799 RepID=A0ABV9DBQ1_9MICO|nr:PQQ-dependent sugar dehydrogenase [Georgenia faecalis]
MLAALTLALVACSATDDGGTPAPSSPSASPSAPAPTSAVPTPSAASPPPPTTAPTTSPASTPPAEPEVVAAGLDVPWGLAFLPDGSALVTLRDRAEVLRVRRGAEPVSVGTVPGVAAENEAGLLGIAVSPAVATDGYVFVYLTAADENRVLRMRLDGDTLVPDVVVLSGIPRESYHNGGRLAFGPDGYLYVATGDAAVPDRAQDPDSLGGKILRVTVDGAPAPGNPDAGSPVWSSGHRNVQGLAWDDDGRMFATEFGQNTWDELNLIEAGGNYGWPVVEGVAGEDGFADPLAQWSPADASPSGLAVTADAAYLAALRGESLWRVPLADDGTTGEPQRLLAGEYGRLRTVAVAPDGALWLVTSNTFRGAPREGDDRVIALDEGWL